MATQISDDLLATFIPILVYWIYSGFYVLLESWDKFRLHSRKDEEEKNLVSKRSVVKGVLLLQSVQALIATLVFAGVTKADSKENGTGNISVLTLGRQYVVAAFVLDTWQYFVHRCLHQNKFLYKHVHAQHHQLVVPYSYGAMYNHPVEGLLDILGCALSFQISGMTTWNPIFFFSFISLKVVDDHCGMWLPGNLFQMFFKNNAAYHDIHHQLHGSKDNFAQTFFTFWDRICGTYMPYTVVDRAGGGGLEAKPLDVKDD